MLVLHAHALLQGLLQIVVDVHCSVAYRVGYESHATRRGCG